MTDCIAREVDDERLAVWQAATARGTMADNSSREARAGVKMLQWSALPSETTVAPLGEKSSAVQGWA